MDGFQTLFQSFSPDSHARGKQFEQVCRWFLETDPHYASRLQKVWLWDDWPGRWGADCGIDLVAKDTDGKVWAIQAKCYDPTYSITKHDIDRFLSESTNEGIDYRLLIASTDQLGANARNVIVRQNVVIPVNMVLLNDLQQASLVWPASVDELDTGHVAAKSTPRPHQEEAIEAIADSLVDRGQMIMACGTGKTLTALWIAERLGSKRTLVLLPSLLLLSKTLADWVAHANEPFAYLPVCSDETVTRGADVVMSSTSELAFPSTTDTEQIASFLRKSGTRVVFSTYQSSPQIAKAFRQGKVPSFDLVIADEAHRCAGKTNSEYGTVLDEMAIPARKRLFMTATPRVYTPHLRKAAEDSGIDVASMDDEAVFGPVLHRLPFGQAIEENLLSDYQVVVVGIDDPTYQQMVADRRLVETETGIKSDARSMASHIGLAKAMDKYDLRRVITFHSRVNWARQFATELSEVLDWMPERYRPSGQITSSYVSGKMSTSLRNQRLASLASVEEGQIAVVANARCLSEGVDVPALDGVAFIDPRKSEIDIVQAVGRAIRLAPDKVKGTIIIPVFISDGDDPDLVLNSSEFDKVWKVVNALRAHDEALGEELDGLRTQLGKRGSTGRPTKVVFDVPTAIGRQFANAFDTRLVERTTATWHFWIGLLQAYVMREGNARVPDKYKAPDGYNLGTWLREQRRNRNKLSSEKVAQLESLPGWTWNVLQTRWEEGCSHLEDYVNQEGNARVPEAYALSDGYELGKWVRIQRAMRNRLSAERVAQLESLPGWTWNVIETLWDESFSRLEDYVNKEGNARVPKACELPDGFKLGVWVATQRRRRQILSSERFTLLDSLPGWTWNATDSWWDDGYSHLEDFVYMEGNARVPVGYVSPDGFKLGMWINNRRRTRNELSAEQVAQLESFPGWNWKPRSSQWDEGITQLKDYVKLKGNAEVSTSHVSPDGYELGKWTQAQRNSKNKNRLSTEQIAQLDSIPGWSWKDS